MWRHYLEPLGLSISEVAKGLGVSRKTPSKVVNERGAVTPDVRGHAKRSVAGTAKGISAGRAKEITFGTAKQISLGTAKEISAAPASSIGTTSSQRRLRPWLLHA
ncbi:MAG: hypothetical protein JOY51_09400 [Nevskia sp.]|nr:hypothetical protein [Nevskia sp.]